MILVDDVSSDRDRAQAAYETLRQHVLGGSPLAAPMGLVVLMRQGVAGWLKRRSTSEALDGPSVRPKLRAAMSGALDEMQADIVGMLATMALLGREGIA